MHVIQGAEVSGVIRLTVRAPFPSLKTRKDRPEDWRFSIARSRFTRGLVIATFVSVTLLTHCESFREVAMRIPATTDSAGAGRIVTRGSYSRTHEPNPSANTVPL